MTATKAPDIDVRSTTDTEHCWVSGLAVLSNNRILIVDRSNRKVKLFYSHSNKLLSELKVSSRPWDITVINKDQAAVTLPDSKIILLMSVTDTLTGVREITVNGECHGVAFSQGRLSVTFVDNPRLELIDLRGKVFRTIEKNGADGSKLFTMPQYVCVSKDGETIYVSDFYRNKVTSLTFDGVVKTVYKNEKLRNPQKVCTDPQGNVYVCGYYSRNVHMIAADCKKVKVILTQADGLNSKVQSVSHCQDTNRLFVGILSNNKVQVYQM